MGQAKKRGTYEQRRAAAGSRAPVPQRGTPGKRAAIRATVKVVDPSIRRFVINKPEQATRLVRLYARTRALRASQTL